jgi:hypothetical protein
MKAQRDAIAAFFDQYPAAVSLRAHRLRDCVRAALPDAREELDRPGRVVGYGYDSGYSGLVCTLILSKTGVKLGIVGGAHLPDAAGLLAGAGKQHRHIAFTQPSDFKRPGIRELLQSALLRYQDRQRERGATKRQPETRKERTRQDGGPRRPM